MLVGEILRPQGLDGTVKVRVFMDMPEFILPLEKLYINHQDEYKQVMVESARVHDGFAFLKLDCISGRDGAEAHRGSMLYMDREDAPALPEGRHFINDIIGCSLVDETGKLLGTVRDVLQPGANDVYVVDTERGEMLVPVIELVVLQVDVVGRQIHVDGQRLSEVSVLAD